MAGLLLSLLPWAPLPAHADATPPTLRIRGLPDERAAEGPPADLGRHAEHASRAELRDWLCDALGRVELARSEERKAAARYRRMRRDDYPRGEPRELIKEWRLRARAELADAERSLADLRERADWRIDADDALATCTREAGGDDS